VLVFYVKGNFLKDLVLGEQVDSTHSQLVQSASPQGFLKTDILAAKTSFSVN